jgi:orotate phosphoribosyltransferase
MIDPGKKVEIKETIQKFIDEKCLFRCNPDFEYVPKYKKGVILGKSKDLKYQFFLRNLSHNSTMVYYTSLLLLDEILLYYKLNEKEPCFQLCGLESGSLPLISAIQQNALKFNININSFTVRKKRKSYGLFNFIEGIPTEAPVIIIDDLINSGSSCFHCLDICKYELNLEVLTEFYSVVTLADNPYCFKFKDDTYNINSLFVKEDFDMEYNSDKYWLPGDCDKSINKRPEYQQGILF